MLLCSVSHEGVVCGVSSCRVALGEIVTLACPGNEIENLHLVEAKARCLEDGLLMVDDSVSIIQCLRTDLHVSFYG